jgi:hypothetical protein
MPRSIINQLSNDLEAVIDTGNPEEAKLVRINIVESRLNKHITMTEAADLLMRYYENFEE